MRKIRTQRVPLLPTVPLFRLARAILIALLELLGSAVHMAAWPSGTSPPLADLADDARCLSCHRNQGPYLQTAHHLTSQLPAATAILGSFASGSDTLKIQDPAPVIGDPGLVYRLEARADGFYQTAITGFQEKPEVRSERMDIVIGSGVRGQSYLYWHDDGLFELPVSYWSDGKHWINSPGYRNGPPDFGRVAVPRCLECHATFIEPISPGPATNRYRKETFIPGIRCAVCHGPGALHVASEQAAARPGARADTSLPAGKILNPAKFSRDRQVDLCALCHNGAQRVPKTPAFSYEPGQPLDQHLSASLADTDPRPDVHADQVGLLKRSKCYLGSPGMSCSTCHQVHAPEQSPASYSMRCLSCHQARSCRPAKKMGSGVTADCIGCHMPVQATDAIVSETADTAVRTSMRTHWIKVY